jgi:ubiquinone/menaquinone biosynthesis C-methylase UbiE
MTHSHSHLADLLDLDAEVLSEYHRDVITWAGAQAPASPQIIDLGAGTGTGTLSLVSHLPHATVTAVDVDEQMLAHLRHRAASLGVADRIRTVQADLDQPWPDLGPADLIWASASLHHLADPAQALARAFAVLRPGGVFAVTELDSFPRFLTDAAGSALEDRCHEELARFRREHGMHLDEDWGARLAEAGFTVEAERRFDIVLEPPLPPAAGRYAQVSVQRMRHGLEDRLPADDLAALEKIAADMADRTDLTIRTVRRAWLARRPA